MAFLPILSGGDELFDIPFPEGAARPRAAAAGETGPGREHPAALPEPLFPRRYGVPLFCISGEDALRHGPALLSSSPCPAPAGPYSHASAKTEVSPEEPARAVARNAAAPERFRNKEKGGSTSGGRLSEDPSGTRADK